MTKHLKTSKFHSAAHNTVSRTVLIELANYMLSKFGYLSTSAIVAAAAAAADTDDSRHYTRYVITPEVPPDRPPAHYHRLTVRHENETGTVMIV